MTGEHYRVRRVGRLDRIGDDDVTRLRANFRMPVQQTNDEHAPSLHVLRICRVQGEPQLGNDRAARVVVVRTRLVWGNVTGPREELRRIITEALEVPTGNLQEIADAAGVSYDTLSAWANGRRNPTPENQSGSPTRLRSGQSDCTSR